MRYLGIVGLTLMIASPAIASDDNGYDAIRTGHLAKAAVQLEAANRATPGQPETMLNLAAVYLKTGRTIEARALYRDVLAQSEVAMEMPSGVTLSSHAVATRGLSGLRQIATR